MTFKKIVLVILLFTLILSKTSCTIDEVTITESETIIKPSHDVDIIENSTLGVVCASCGANLDAGEKHKVNCGEPDDDDVIEK